MGASIMVVHSSEQEDGFDESRIVYLTREEEFAILDKAARRYLDMSGEEFLRRWETGDFEEPDSFEVIYVGLRVPPAVEE